MPKGVIESIPSGSRAAMKVTSMVSMTMDDRVLKTDIIRSIS